MDKAVLLSYLLLVASCIEPSQKQNQEGDILRMAVQEANGINIYLKCTDGQQIFVPLGYGKFKVIDQGKIGQDFYLTSCNGTYGELGSYSFRNCYHKTRGRKVNGTIIESAWEKAGDSPQVYSGKKKIALWKDLVLECRSLAEPPPEEDGY